jgi:cell division protein FtsB
MNYERLMSSVYKLLLAGVVVFAGYCLWQLWGLHQEHARLLQVETDMRTRLADEQKKLRDNQRTLERLRTDPEFVDMVIRRRLGYAKPGELIFRFEQQDDSYRSILPSANDR